MFVGCSAAPADFLAEAYRALGIDYRKFFKMDNLSKLAFLAAETLMPAATREEAKLDLAVVLYCRNASLETDTAFNRTLAEDNYYPSPSEFVYTLPNVMLGEIAIRHKIYGETACYVSSSPNRGEVFQTVASTLADGAMKRCLCGWADYYCGRYDAEMWLVE
jgi:hypothetical protein